MYTPDPDFPAKPHHFMSKRLGISISLVLFVLVLLLSYALCSLQVDRSTQAILADKNRFLLSKIDTMQIRLQDWRRTMLEQTNTLALSESVRLFAADMAALPSDLLDKSSRTAAPGSDSDQLSLLDQREYMQQLLADIAYQNDLDRIRMFLPNGRKIVDSASDAADNHDDDLLSGRPSHRGRFPLAPSTSMETVSPCRPVPPCSRSAARTGPVSSAACSCASPWTRP